MFNPTISIESVNDLPIAEFNGEIVAVSTPKEAKKALKELSHEWLLGFDTETRPSFTPLQGNLHKTALLQLATGEKAFLFRLALCGGVSFGLKRLLSNPKVIKVGAAVKDDIKGLQFYRHFHPAGFVDLQSITGSFGINEKSLKKLTAIVLGLRLSKGQQLSNWESFELTPAQRQYAALDAWACREIYVQLHLNHPINQ
ncbi:MAG: 3'-5' exonuclease domain-containing protein 2 [Prevotellaceae bacterium]|jgi:ribonuclease D|nr:3'-5' exonuclease domain-containing protein 2 [Prevotellaceae bacterium]